MDFSKLKNKLLIVLCVTVLILPFYLITFTYASTEEVESTQINGLDCSPSRNYFYTNSSGAISYFEIEKGYIYTITLNNNTYDRVYVYSSDLPANNVEYNIIYTFTERGEISYSYLANSDGYLTIKGYNDNFSVTREKVSDMNGAVSGLVDNVGISSIWNIFDISINYIVVVVLFAFGCYTIFRIIRKISRGKEGL